MKKSNLMPSLVLVAICIVATLLLSVINLFTAPIIEERENAKANAALAEVLPGGSNFKSLELSDSYPKSVIEAYSADGGFVFRTVGNGRNGDIVVMVGVTADGKIAGTKVITTSETPKYADSVYSEVEGKNGKYNGQDSESFAEVIIAGSTMTSQGFAGAVKAALNAYTVANGGSVDDRTPEEILQDNCNAALGTSKIKFTKWFKCESVVGVDAVYEAENDGGRVYVIGDSFVGVKDGAVTTADATDENKAAALAADSVISASTLEDITTSLDAFKDALVTEKNAKITKAYKTASGNLLFEMEANGHAVKGDHGNGTPIKIKIAISKDGKIIDVVTVSHAESKGYGDKCATDEYYEQYRGKGDDEIKVSAGSYAGYTDDYISADTTDVGAIASATNTTLGYQKAVKLAFKAFELLIGGNE